VPGALTEQERQEFLAQPHIAVLSVASGSDRPPLTVPIWYGYQPGGDLIFFTGSPGPQGS
jgi:nitroimidazol reductase NimA-like FMN-containing flavoprotein (pyridoxamine 5'-phosphate oxidase superfamily)